MFSEFSLQKHKYQVPCNIVELAFAKKHFKFYRTKVNVSDLVAFLIRIIRIFCMLNTVLNIFVY